MEHSSIWERNLKLEYNMLMRNTVLGEAILQRAADLAQRDTSIGHD